MLPDAFLADEKRIVPIRGCPAGSSAHTAKDLWLFTKALRDGTLLGADWTPWFFRRGASDGSFVVGGGAPGVNAMLDSTPERTFVVLANMDPPAANESLAKLREIWS